MAAGFTPPPAHAQVRDLLSLAQGADAVPCGMEDDTLDLLRDRLADMPNLSTRRMFGGICVMSRGHMVAGVSANGDLMVRVGKPNMESALKLDGVEPMTMGARTMGGFVDVDHGDETALDGALELARAFVSALPAK